jgi:rod shape-determining protein MreD
MRFAFWRSPGRRRRVRASHHQAARVPRQLSFRRRRSEKPPGKAPERALRLLTFRRGRRARKPSPAAPERALRGLTFRRRRQARKPSPKASERTPRLSFRRARPASGAPDARRERKLSLRRRPRAQTREPATTPTEGDPLQLALRLVAIGLVACMLQLLVVSQISVLGVTADLAPLAVSAAGFLCGSLAGAGFGFGVGLLIDLASVQVLGISSLLLTLIGYGAGRVRESRAPAAPLTRLALGAVSTALALTGYGAIEFMLGVNTPVSYGLFGAIVKTTALNSLIALPVYALTRRALLGALPASERLVHRPAATTRGVSPLSRA